MKIFTVLFAFLFSYSYGQLVFEVNQSDSLNGVYPCVSAQSNWNSPNLITNGNWFSDTLQFTNDGTIGSACLPVNSNASGNFALAYRTGCDLRQTLLNIQNSGATGALIIDSVAGRPLPFLNDSIDTNITIPFIIISNDIGENLLSELNSFATIVVSFGDKTGTSTNDVGIYKETSWWSMYGCIPFNKLTLPDTLWGSWVYNHGTDTANNVQLRFYFEINNSFINYYNEVTSIPFNIPPSDSVYIPLALKYNHTLWTAQNNDTLKYGYQLINFIDSDTLDNTIENYIIATNDILSISYQREFQQQNTQDYLIYMSNIIDVYQRYNIIDFDFWGYLNFILKVPIDPSNFNSFGTEMFTFNSQNISSIEQLQSSNLIGFTTMGLGTIPPSSECTDLDAITQYSTDTFDIITNYFYMEYNSGVLFTSDMYHDMRMQTDSAFTVFNISQNFGDTISKAIVDIRLTPTHYMQIIQSEGPYCAGSLEENKINVTISPNPTSDKLNISSNSTIEELTVINLAGRKIITKKINSTSEKLDLKSLNNGLYILYLKTKSGTIVQKKFVKH